MKITRFEDIQCWQLARKLSNAVYSAANRGTFGRDFGLRDQINRSSGSVMDNIAEDYDSGSTPEFIRFLQYAQRSCTEVKSQLHRALDRNHFDQEAFNWLYDLASECHSCIGGFLKYLKQYSMNQKKSSGTAAKGIADKS